MHDNVLKKYSHGWGELILFGQDAKKVMYIEMQLCNQGELFDVIVDALKNGGLKKEDKTKFYNQLLSAVKNIHDAGVVHRDIKLENIFVHNGNLKLADFGFSRIFMGEGATVFSDTIGTLGYMAPELFSHEIYCGVKVDIYAMGIILFMIISGQQIYNTDKSDMIKDPRHNKFYKRFMENPMGVCRVRKIKAPETIMMLIRDMIMVNPEDRPSLDQIQERFS